MVKSASQSVDSAASTKSNFEHRSRIEKFNDKRDSLRNAGLAKLEYLNNQFKDQKVYGPQSYEKAKKDMQSEDWENQIAGIEMIVSISRDMPEVRNRGQSLI